MLGMCVDRRWVWGVGAGLLLVLGSGVAWVGMSEERESGVEIGGGVEQHEVEVVGSDDAERFRADSKYYFDEVIEKEVLGRYLGRSISYLGVCATSEGRAEYFDDHLRVIRDCGVKFVGKASFNDGKVRNWGEFWERAREGAARVHEVDAEIVVQGCIGQMEFDEEGVGSRAMGKGVGDSVRVWKPISVRQQEVSRMAGYSGSREGFERMMEERSGLAWVDRELMAEFGEDGVKRPFVFERMRYEGGEVMRDVWGGGSAMDISRLETRMWVYEQARRYIDAGYEAIEFGQVELMAENDEDMVYWGEVLAMIRAYAKKKARRRSVICSARVTNRGLECDGKVLWDYVSSPMRMVQGKEKMSVRLMGGNVGSIYEDFEIEKKKEGEERGERVMRVFEIGQWRRGVSDDDDLLIWGADEAGWFANQKKERRDAFLRECWEWVNGYVGEGKMMLPGRMRADVPIGKRKMGYYLVNRVSDVCAEGFGQEDVVAELFDREGEKIEVQGQMKVLRSRGGELTKKEMGGGIVGYWSFNRKEEVSGWEVFENHFPLKVYAVVRRGYLRDELIAMYEQAGDWYTQKEQKDAGRLERRVESDADDIFEEGEKGKAVRFMGRGYLDLGGFDEFCGEELTIAMWVKIEDGERGQVIIAKEGGGEWQYRVGFDAENQAGFVRVKSENGEVKKLLMKGMRIGEWEHVAMMVGGGEVRGYLNGELAGEISLGRLMKWNDGRKMRLVIGKGCVGVGGDSLYIFEKMIEEDRLRKLIKGRR